MTKHDDLVFLDCETTGLDIERHQIWELAGIVDGEERRAMLPVDLARADPIALGIGGFHRRHPQGNDYALTVEREQCTTTEIVFDPDHARQVAVDFAQLTHGRHLVGAVISFDEQRLRRMLLSHGIQPSWHYHIIDVEALAVGYLNGKRRKGQKAPAIALPWDSSELSLAVGVDPAEFDKHTALGDAKWARAIYTACVG